MFVNRYGIEELQRSFGGILNTTGLSKEQRNFEKKYLKTYLKGWKDIAKKLIEERSDVSDLLADKFSVLLETEGSSCS